VTREEAETTWSALVRQIRMHDGSDAGIRDELDGIAHDLQHELFGGRPIPGGSYPELERTDARLRLLLDVLQALALLSPDDPSYPWDRALILFVIDRFLEAADDYMTAARLFDVEARAGSGLTGDEADWARSARWHAAKSLVLGGQPAAASALLTSLDPDDRSKIESLLGV
jgi:hypothetical protein